MGGLCPDVVALFYYYPSPSRNVSLNEIFSYIRAHFRLGVGMAMALLRGPVL